MVRALATLKGGWYEETPIPAFLLFACIPGNKPRASEWKGKHMCDSVRKIRKERQRWIGMAGAPQEIARRIDRDIESMGPVVTREGG